jgi:hypothetical protein
MLGCPAAVMAIVTPSQLKPAVSHRIEISSMWHAFCPPNRDMSHARSWAWVALIGVVSYVVARTMPDLARYLRIRQM